MRGFIWKKMEEIPDTNDIKDLWTWLEETLTEAKDIHIRSRNTTGNTKKYQHRDHYDQNITRKIKKKHKCW